MIGGTDYRDPITQQLLARQAAMRRQQQTGAAAGPLAAPRPAPVMGTPAPRPQEAPSPYGFQAGFNAAYGTPASDPTRKDQGWSDLYRKARGFFGDEDAWASGSGGAAP